MNLIVNKFKMMYDFFWEMSFETIKKDNIDKRDKIAKKLFT